MVLYAKEIQIDDYSSDEDEVIQDDRPSAFHSSYKGLLHE